MEPRTYKDLGFSTKIPKQNDEQLTNETKYRKYTFKTALYNQTQ